MENEKVAAEKKRNSKEEGELRCGGSGTAKHHRTEDRCAGSRCTRDQREELEEADVKCGLVTNLGYFLYAEFRVLVAVLEGNKNDTVDD